MIVTSVCLFVLRISKKLLTHLKKTRGRKLGRLQYVFANLNLAITVTLFFDLLTLKSYHYVGYPKVIPRTKVEHVGISCFWVIVRTNKQTNKQNHTHTDWQTRMIALSPVSITWVDGRAFPLAELTRLVETCARQHGPCWRVMETGHPSTRAVN